MRQTPVRSPTSSTSRATLPQFIDCTWEGIGGQQRSRRIEPGTQISHTGQLAPLSLNGGALASPGLCWGLRWWRKECNLVGALAQYIAEFLPAVRGTRPLYRDEHQTRREGLRGTLPGDTAGAGAPMAGMVGTPATRAAGAPVGAPPSEPTAAAPPIHCRRPAPPQARKRRNVVCSERPTGQRQHDARDRLPSSIDLLLRTHKPQSQPRKPRPNFRVLEQHRSSIPR